MAVHEIIIDQHLGQCVAVVFGNRDKFYLTMISNGVRPSRAVLLNDAEYGDGLIQGF